MSVIPEAAMLAKRAAAIRDAYSQFKLVNTGVMDPALAICAPRNFRSAGLTIIQAEKTC
jgi:hypothetical protein